jgi:hypothetical protein
MAEKLASKTSTGQEELKITFEKGGESASIFIPLSKLRKGKGMDDAQRILGEVACGICCAHKKGFAACFARCMDDGKCCDNGATNCD